MKATCIRQGQISSIKVPAFHEAVKHAVSTCAVLRIMMSLTCAQASLPQNADEEGPTSFESVGGLVADYRTNSISQ